MQTTGKTLPPNLLLIVTDQQRHPQQWPTDPQWLDALAPADAELRRTGVQFTHAFTATAMCSPSRASFLTGCYPSRHGVTLTLTEGDLWPDPRNFADVVRALLAMLMAGKVPRWRALRTFFEAGLRRGPRSGSEPELPVGVQTLATVLRERGYEVVLKGKWHLTKPVSEGGWSEADSQRIERDFGFAEWEPPDAGGHVSPDEFGGGNAGTTQEGWDEDYTRQAQRWLGQANLPEPFCLIVSLINPHDVLGYPNSYTDGGYSAAQFGDLDVGLPATIDEDLRDKPTVHSLMALGQIAYIGALKNRRAQHDYVNFYAHLHRVVDRHVGRVIDALGDVDEPSSLRSRTVIARFSDHGEMGLSHGGLRQKMFNAYEESIRVPLIISNPLLFPNGGSSDALVSLVDLVPTLLGIAGAGVGDASQAGFDGQDLTPLLASLADCDGSALAESGVNFGALGGGSEAVLGPVAVRDHILFTYDDHQAGTARQEAPGQPNRIRCVRDRRWKYAVYLDPTGNAAAEYECYDLVADPNEALNLVDYKTGRGRNSEVERERVRLHSLLWDECQRTATLTPTLPALPL